MSRVLHACLCGLHALPARPTLVQLHLCSYGSCLVLEEVHGQPPYANLRGSERVFVQARDGRDGGDPPGL